jgi:TolB protein
MRYLFCAAAALALCIGAASAAPVGEFTDHRDIGRPRHAGSASYDAATRTYRITGGGQNMWAARDDFHYAYKPMSGDFRATVDLKFTSHTPKEGAPGFLHRKGGIVVRQDLDTDSAYVDVLRMGNAQMSIQYRETKGGLTHLIWINTTRQDTVRMEKIGDYFHIAVLGPDGQLRHGGGSFKVRFTGQYYFGLGVCPHDDAITDTMEFANLRIETGPRPRMPVHSTLQTMRVNNQVEQIAVVSAPGAITDTAWSADGASLTYRSGGASWRVSSDVDTPAAPVKVAAPDAGPRQNANWIYYSDPKSGKLWRVRPGNGERVPVTTDTGTRDFSPQVSPDGRWVVYAAAPANVAAGRDSDLEIRLIPVSADGVPDVGRTLLAAKPHGGPATLASNAWSPDSRSFAFISKEPGR